MSRGRRRDEWERTAALVHWIAAKSFAGELVDPEVINPIPPLMAEVEDLEAAAAEAAEGWANLRAGLAEHARQRHGGRRS